MKISPVPSVATAMPTSPNPMVDKVRALKMSTNATPLSQAEMLAPEETNQNLAIPDTNEPVKEEAEVTQPLSPQLAAIAKARRALQVKERELADREKALSEQKPSEGSVIDVAQLKSRPWSVLQELGVSAEQLRDAILADQSGITPEISALKAELKALKENVDKTFTDKDEQAIKQHLSLKTREATKLVAEGGDAYELVRDRNKIPAAIKLMELTYRESGEVMETSEALKLIEDELMTDGLSFVKSKKLQSQIVPPALPESTLPQQQQKQMRTLTNRDTATIPVDRKKRAMAAFLGQKL